MFGLLSPARRDSNYCRAYAHVCQSHRKHSGLGLLPFHSYESILLYLLSVDAGVVPLDDKAPVRCCQLAKRASRLTLADERVSRFCSAFSTLLAFIKLKDDLADSKSIRARILLKLFGRRFAAAFEFFETLDNQFTVRIERILKAQADIESKNVSPELSDFTAPTGEGFGYLFGLLTRSWALPHLTPALESIGNAIGRAIICFDVAYDYDEDVLKKRFNPLRERSLREHALNLAKKYLIEAGNVASATFGEESIAGSLCHSVESSIGNDKEGGPDKLESVFEEEVPEAFKMGKVFGFVPFPLLAANNSDGQAMIGMLCCCACVAMVGKSCCEWKGVITETGPCGQKRTKKTRRTSGPCG